MHEFSLCQGIISQVLKACPTSPSSIKSVKITLGEQAGVDIESLQFWFPIVARQFNLPQLELKVETVAAVARCLTCKQEFEVTSLISPCPHCATYANYTLITGKELLVKSIELN